MDPIFSKNIVVDEKHPLRVFIQLRGDCKGVYVTNESQYGFDVIELDGGRSNAKFNWSVIANRADEVNPDGTIARYSEERFAPAIGPQPTIQGQASRETKKAENMELPPTRELKEIQKKDKKTEGHLELQPVQMKTKEQKAE